MITDNGTKNPLIKILKDGDVVLMEIPSISRTLMQIVRLKNLKYQPANEEFDFDWLEFEGDVLYVNARHHQSMLSPIGNCLSITEIIPTELIENYAKKYDMWRSDLHLLSDAEFEVKKKMYL